MSAIKRRFLGTTIVVVLIGGCGRGAAAPAASQPPAAAVPAPSITTAMSTTLSSSTPRSAAEASETAGATPTELPVGTSLEAVSRSHPTQEALAALDLCHVTDGYGIDSVARMALVPHASVAGSYVPLTGREPYLQTQEPAWLILFGKGIDMPMEDATWYGAFCAVVDQAAGFYGTGDIVTNGGARTTPPPVEHPPTAALPTLAP